ncbi:hypothetical protein DLNHIDIE_03365 [Acidithiobacillus thiooxidans ATCC 19377]|uniref:Uncharacterized protein n=1 Tax=Acidithiobacillus thiooxidans ATCC 19377 TaxID=637390 RepID=A0A543PZ07_ACITH|nr:hypothetical protein DLNHIDIE_03365 [Acidithiobacillus thiooxidans ATCC 19377]
MNRENDMKKNCVVTLVVTTALNDVEIVTELLHPRWERKQAH